VATVRKRSETVKLYVEDAKKALSRLKAKKLPMFVLGMLVLSHQRAAEKAAALGPKHDHQLIPVIPLCYASSVEQMRWIGSRAAPCIVDNSVILHTFKRVTEVYRPRRPYWIIVSPVERINDPRMLIGVIPGTIEEVFAFSMQIGIEKGQYIDAAGDSVQYMTVVSGAPAVVPASPYVCRDYKTDGRTNRVAFHTCLSALPFRSAFRGEVRRNVFIREGGIVE